MRHSRSLQRSSLSGTNGSLNNPKKAKDWAKPGNLSQISGQAREISLHMNQAGVMAFQRGALSNIFQFMSHNTKMWQALIPEWVPVLGTISDRSFAGSQRAALWLSQTAIYGLGAFGLHEMYDKFVANNNIDVPNDVDLYIREGIAGSLYNAMMRVSDDPDHYLRTTLDVSGNIAPASGAFAGSVPGRVGSLS